MVPADGWYGVYNVRSTAGGPFGTSPLTLAQPAFG